MIAQGLPKAVSYQGIEHWWRCRVTQLNLAIWLVHLLATFAMFGVIWMVQLVQYPLFKDVGSTAFQEYHAGHVTRITYVVLPLMTLEVATAVGFTWLQSISGANAYAWYASLVSLAGIWASTVLWQVPTHEKLANGFHERAHATLVGGNWLRTGLWSVRAAAVLYCSYLIMAAR